MAADAYDPFNDPHLISGAWPAEPGDTCVICGFPAVWREKNADDTKPVKVCREHSKKSPSKDNTLGSLVFTNDGLQTDVIERFRRERTDALLRCTEPSLLVRTTVTPDRVVYTRPSEEEARQIRQRQAEYIEARGDGGALNPSAEPSLGADNMIWFWSVRTCTHPKGPHGVRCGVVATHVDAHGEPCCDEHHGEPCPPFIDSSGLVMGDVDLDEDAAAIRALLTKPCVCSSRDVAIWKHEYDDAHPSQEWFLQCNACERKVRAPTPIIEWVAQAWNT